MDSNLDHPFDESLDKHMSTFEPPSSLDCDKHNTEIKTEPEDTIDEPEVKYENLYNSDVPNVNSVKVEFTERIEAEPKIEIEDEPKIDIEETVVNSELFNKLDNRFVKENSRYKCKSCSFSHTHVRIIRRHTKVHTEKQCTKCNYVTMDAYELKIHMRAHASEKPFTCTKCDYSAKYISQIRSHEITHTKVKPHICTICDLAFGKQSTLKRHLTTHSNETRCKFCSYTKSHTCATVIEEPKIDYFIGTKLRK